MEKLQEQKFDVPLCCILALAFALINYFWLAMTDMQIASSLGAFRKLPPGPYGQWTEIGAIDWTWSSLLGVAMSLYQPLFWVLMLYAGFTLSLLLMNLANKVKNPYGGKMWILWSVLLLWLVRVPVPIEYSLFYWIAIKY